jgi:hypothetical protein
VNAHQHGMVPLVPAGARKCDLFPSLQLMSFLINLHQICQRKVHLFLSIINQTLRFTSQLLRAITACCRCRCRCRCRTPRCPRPSCSSCMCRRRWLLRRGIVDGPGTPSQGGDSGVCVTAGVNDC